VRRLLTDDLARSTTEPGILLCGQLPRSPSRKEWPSGIPRILAHDTVQASSKATITCGIRANLEFRRHQPASSLLPAWLVLPRCFAETNQHCITVFSARFIIVLAAHHRFHLSARLLSHPDRPHTAVHAGFGAQRHHSQQIADSGLMNARHLPSRCIAARWAARSRARVPGSAVTGGLTPTSRSRNLRFCGAPCVTSSRRSELSAGRGRLILFPAEFLKNKPDTIQ